MKIAVTGASGFVGKHVLDVLSKDPGVTVVAASRSAEQCAEAGGRIRHVRIDIADPGPDDYDRLGRPDVLLHLAWDGLPNYKSLHHFERHLAEQYGFLAGLVRAGLPAVVCTGTCFEYGMCNGELDESLPTDPANAYACAKDALRRQLELLSKTVPLRLTWARLFYMFGSGQNPASLYSLLCAALARGDASFPMSGGEQLRDYLPIETVASHLVTLARSPQAFGIVNVCSGRPVCQRPGACVHRRQKRSE